jgi:hypothetical protein
MRVTIFVVEKQKLLHVCVCACVCVCVCVCERERVRVGALVRGRVHACSLAYLACNSYAPHYDVVCGTSDSSKSCDIFSQTARFSERKSLNVKCVFWFSLLLLSKTFLILRII